MKIVIVSDTHMPHRAKQLPLRLTEALREAELIIHAGDWTGPEVVDLFEQFAPVESAAGNNDGNELAERFGKRKILQLEGFRIGLIHGDAGIGRKTEDKAFDAFRRERVDLIVFGHSHIPFMEKREDVWMFNPGSPTDKRFQPEYSYGLLELDGTIKLRHVFYPNKQ